MTREKYYEFQDNTSSIYGICAYCGRHIRFDCIEIFCTKKCEKLYFKRKCDIIEGKYMSKKKQNKHHVYEFTDIISERDLKDLIRETEENIDIINKKEIKNEDNL